MTNKAIVNGLKKRLDSAKGTWIEELPNVLWAYWTTPQGSTSETPYSMTYGTEVVILVEISMLSMKVLDFSLASNKELMTEQLDLLEEHQEMATIRLVDY